MQIKKGTSKSKASAAAPEAKENACAKCDAKIEAVELKIADLMKAQNTELEKVKKLSATKTFKNTPKSEKQTEVKTNLSQDERIFAIFNKIKNK